VRLARRLLREYPVKGLRLKPLSPVAVTGGGSALYHLDELKSRGGGPGEVRPGDANHVDPVHQFTGPVQVWCYEGSKRSARRATRGQYSEQDEPLVPLRGTTVLRAGLAFDEVDQRFRVLEVRSVMVSAIAPLEM